MNDVYALVLAGGVGSRLSILTSERAKPAVPFGGKYRIIDFVLSNCANSGIFDVGVLTQYRPMSLIDHVGTGSTWDLDRTLEGLQILQPYLEGEGGDWYRGTADAVYRNLLQILQRSADDILVLSGDHVYAMDYRALIDLHREGGYPATVAVTPVPREFTDQFGIVEVDSKGCIRGFEEKPKNARGNLASMGIYVFRREELIRLLREDAEDPGSARDFGRNIFPRLTASTDVGAYTYHGYWRDIGTVSAFYEANLKLLDPRHTLKLGHASWPIRTPSTDAPPVRVTGQGSLHGSQATNGAIVGGEVTGSLLSPGVVIEPGAVVRDSILLRDVRVEAGARVERAILDKRTRIGRNARLGGEPGGEANHEQPELLSNGITLTGKEVHLGEGAVVGRNCCLGGRITIDAGAELADGTTVPGNVPRHLQAHFLARKRAAGG